MSFVKFSDSSGVASGSCSTVAVLLVDFPAARPGDREGGDRPAGDHLSLSFCPLAAADGAARFWDMKALGYYFWFALSLLISDLMRSYASLGFVPGCARPSSFLSLASCFLSPVIWALPFFSFTCSVPDLESFAFFITVIWAETFY